MRVGVDLSQKEYDSICRSKIPRLGLSRTAIDAIKEGVELTGAESIIPCEPEVNTETLEDKASENSSKSNNKENIIDIEFILALLITTGIIIGAIIGIIKLIIHVINRYIAPVIEELRQGVEAQGYTLNNLIGLLVFTIILSLVLTCLSKILMFMDRL